MELGDSNSFSCEETAVIAICNGLRVAKQREKKNVGEGYLCLRLRVTATIATTIMMTTTAAMI